MAGPGTFITRFDELVALRRMTPAETVREFARSVALTTMSKITRLSATPSLRLLYCHHVFDDQRADFAAIVISLKRLGTFVDTDTCVNMLTGAVELNGKYFHLSFDDGFRNVFTNALPILLRHQVPAEIFVPTDLISASHDRLERYCLNTTHQGGVIEMMRWDDLKEAADLGFGISSHTSTHARLSDVTHSPTCLENEIVGSKNRIQRELGRECKYISWTYGGLRDINPTVMNVIRDAKYAACFGAFRGCVRPGTTDRYTIPRHHFEPEWPLSHIKLFASGAMERRYR